MAEKSFTLQVPDSELEYLKKKLELTRFPDELEGAGWEYGAPLVDIKRLVTRWKDGFNWRASEDHINSFPQFTRDIELEGHGTLNIHYIHKRSELGDNAIPLLFVHGWPGHFMEVSKILPLLTAVSPDQPSFHVVALSLPGYGFSDAARLPGFSSAEKFAEVGHKLMLALGYKEYVTQAGDWGYTITRKMQVMYGGTHVKAWHTNFSPLDPPQITKQPWHYLKWLVTPLTERDRAGFARTRWFRTEGYGYFLEQSTQPQTLGYSVADSPVGLLAWIYEKLVVWTDDYPWTDDEVLEWVSIYWFSKAGPAASLRIYYDASKAGELGNNVPRTNVPYGLSYFPKEIIYAPKAWARMIGNVVLEVDHNAGGHFAAHEQPELLAGDVKKMFGVGGPAYGVVPGKNGYAIGE
ncbi:alpha/beta-hydrolase [Panus rudis PR-1116 ss-1]|nr:alpha/beta-hydrolase [Panus rudis PR-1116 ss-1]